MKLLTALITILSLATASCASTRHFVAHAINGAADGGLKASQAPRPRSINCQSMVNGQWVQTYCN